LKVEFPDVEETEDFMLCSPFAKCRQKIAACFKNGDALEETDESLTPP
jgi:hypothetical protein